MIKGTKAEVPALVAGTVANAVASAPVAVADATVAGADGTTAAAVAADTAVANPVADSVATSMSVAADGSVPALGDPALSTGPGPRVTVAPRAAASPGPVPVRVPGRALWPAVAPSFFEPSDPVAGAAAFTATPSHLSDPRNQGTSSGDVAAFVRATLSRYIAAAAPTADAASPTTAIGNRPVGLSIPVLSDSGAAVNAVAVDSQAQAAMLAGAARVPFQIAQSEAFEAPSWARNELAKAAQLVGDTTAVERLAHRGSGFGDNSPASSGDQRNPARDGGAGTAAMAYAAALSLPGSMAASIDTRSFETAAARAAAVPTEPSTESGSLTHSIVRVIKLQTTAGGGEIQLRLRPEHLGELTVSVRVQGGAVSAALLSDSPDVRAWIQQHQQDLRSSLKDQGLSLEQLTVDPEGHQRQRQGAPEDGAERRPSNRRQEAPGRFEALI